MIVFVRLNNEIIEHETGVNFIDEFLTLRLRDITNSSGFREITVIHVGVADGVPYYIPEEILR